MVALKQLAESFGFPAVDGSRALIDAPGAGEAGGGALHGPHLVAYLRSTPHAQVWRLETYDAAGKPITDFLRLCEVHGLASGLMVREADALADRCPFCAADEQASEWRRRFAALRDVLRVRGAR